MSSSLNPRNLFRNLIPTRRARKASPANRGRANLGFEMLESRQMLAADMTEIVGIIRLDSQNDGNPINDILVQGAQVRLYRDGGDGVFNNGGGDDSSAAGVVTSDSAGHYRFVGLTAGKYFVKIELPSGLQTNAGGDVKTVTITAPDAAGAIGKTIDEFDSVQKVEASPPPDSAGVGSTKIDGTVLGGERDFHVQITAGTDEFSSVSLISAGGLLRLASSSLVTGNATVVWDGQDGNASAINYTGLGGLDFTHDGPNTMTGIRLSVGADHAGSIVKLRIYSDASHWSEFTTTVPESAGGAIDKQVVFNFSTPSSTGGGGADFTKVGAIELTFVGVSAVDATISVAELVGLTTKSADFTAYNKLSLGDQVFLDGNNNGVLDGSDHGIGGVKMNLYSDTDGNNQYTPGVDAFVATTTTDSSGKYLFNNLVTGSYIVQVDPTNFNNGQALVGLQTSNGKTATDPDDNVDNDDNGAALAGSGVVSMAISLASGAEPTNDGDDATGNRTVDFGFFGFDLVLDKSVDQTAISPLEELTYTVLVVNDGPATAKNVQFKDTLPANVTFESYTVSKAGVTLSHANGLVTGTLGDMADGAQIIIVIKARVKAGATGTLLNQADVSAVDEVYLLNNHDEVETPITPKIDLEIDKTDSQDPVAPGAQFSYPIVITNNGPSNATGVIVTDTLPNHVTFVSSTRTNVGTGGVLQFDIGNLAVGASTTITVTVQVDPTFVGTLLNVCEVHANEVETDYTNNQDEEPTTVAALPGRQDGYVYVDKNNNGVKDAGESPLAGVQINLTGNETVGGKFISRTAYTNSNGYYSFENLMPGTYLVFQPTQPAKYKDGRESLGNMFNAQGQSQSARGLVSPDGQEGDARDGEAFEGIVIQSGFAAKDYNFGELAVTINKRDFVRPLVWR